MRLPIVFDKDQIVEFKYINYKGEYSHRRVKIIAIEFTSTPYHQRSQFLLRGIDLDKEAERSFAMSDIYHLMWHL